MSLSIYFTIIAPVVNTNFYFFFNYNIFITFALSNYQIIKKKIMVNSHHVLTAIKDSFVEMDNAFIYAIQTAQAFDEAMALDYQTVNLIEDVYNTTFEDFAQLINPYQDSDMGLTDEIKTKIDHGEHLTMNQQYIDELQNLIQEVDEMSNDIDEIIENIDTPGLSHQYIDHLTHSINIKPAIDKFTQVLNNYFQVNV